MAPSSFSHRAVDFLAAGDLVTLFTALAALVCRRGGAAEALRQTADTIRQGPERLEKFDEALFAELVEQIVASPTALRFRLYGGIEVTEQIGEDER